VAVYETMPAGIEVSGGSAANTAAGIASLGGAATFIGKVRDDALGEIFVHDLRSTGVMYNVPPGTSGPPTARSLILVTPPSVHLVDAPDDREELAARRMHEPEFTAAIAARDAGPDMSTDETWAEFRAAIAPLGYAAWGPVERAHAPVGDQHVESIKAFFTAEPPDELPDRLGAVEAPVLVVAGRQDLSTGLEPVRALAGLFTNGRIEEIDDCGHFPWVEQPEAFRAAVVPFLTR